MDDRTKKMAQEIVRLRFSGITDDLSNDYCHYQAYPLKEKKMSDVDCNSMTCNECRQEYKPKNATGNFAYVLFANEKQDINTPLKEGEKPLPIYRGDKVYISWSGLCDINE